MTEHALVAGQSTKSYILDLEALVPFSACHRCTKASTRAIQGLRLDRPWHCMCLEMCHLHRIRPCYIWTRSFSFSYWSITSAPLMNIFFPNPRSRSVIVARSYRIGLASGLLRYKSGVILPSRNIVTQSKSTGRHGITSSSCARNTVCVGPPLTVEGVAGCCRPDKDCSCVVLAACRCRTQNSTQRVKNTAGFREIGGVKFQGVGLNLLENRTFSYSRNRCTCFNTSILLLNSV
jgi:hypothetical protein